MLLLGAVSACNSDSEEEKNAKEQSKIWKQYAGWREQNEKFFERQRDSLDADGNFFYQSVRPSWNPAAEVLIHYFTDRDETAANLQPMLTSTVDIIYYARQSNGEPADSSYLQTEYGRAVARFEIRKTIKGVAIALMEMHAGDSVQVVVPYTLAYGASTSTSFPPFTTLVFNMRLVDIPYYEIRP